MVMTSEPPIGAGRFLEPTMATHFMIKKRGPTVGSGATRIAIRSLTHRFHRDLETMSQSFSGRIVAKGELNRNDFAPYPADHNLTILLPVGDLRQQQRGIDIAGRGMRN